jgi:hypothetical protein
MQLPLAFVGVAGDAGDPASAGGLAEPLQRQL